MSTTTKAVRSSLFATAFARMQVFVARIVAPAGAGSDLMELYRLSRGSDSVRPAVIRRLAANAAR
ncbi:hypothetical protein [Massilia niabensis]|uniref:Uncharacterized protein n=1 Tax=Massilia niabensis TaxID=544910 RepID=A0ABW0LAN9_9BURK